MIIQFVHGSTLELVLGTATFLGFYPSPEVHSISKVSFRRYSLQTGCLRLLLAHVLRLDLGCPTAQIYCLAIGGISKATRGLLALLILRSQEALAEA